MIGLSMIVVLFVSTAACVIATLTRRDPPIDVGVPSPAALRPAPAELVAMLPAHVRERGVAMVVCTRR